jgi:5-methylcytosine-specific restriction endonuclease McrA
MKRKSISDYTPDWPEIAKKVKNEAGWKCVRCGHHHEVETGYVLTVHHLDLDPANNEWWNIPPLCQRCHLHIQGKVIMERKWMFDHSDWFKPYAAGYYAYQHGLPADHDYVMAHLDELLEYGKPMYREETL